MARRALILSGITAMVAVRAAWLMGPAHHETAVAQPLAIVPPNEAELYARLNRLRDTLPALADRYIRHLRDEFDLLRAYARRVQDLSVDCRAMAIETTGTNRCSRNCESAPSMFVTRRSPSSDATPAVTQHN